MKIVFMGTPGFAVPSLQVLIDKGYNIAGVITAPDKPAGRGLHVQMSPVKMCAIGNNIPVLQPEKLKDPEFIKTLQALHADLFIVVAFRMLPEVVWQMPPKGAFNLHASILPNYRGAAPINWAVINGEKETGVTTFFLQHAIDTGDIIYSEKVRIDEFDTAGEVHDKLMKVGASLVLKTVRAIESNALKPQPQPIMNNLKTAPKIHTSDCAIDFNKSSEDVYNQIRGLSPYPGAFTHLNGKLIKIFFAHPVEAHHDEAVGSTASDGHSYLRFYTNDGYIEATDVQLEGKKRLPIAEFLKGYKYTGQ